MSSERVKEAPINAPVVATAPKADGAPHETAHTETVQGERRRMRPEDRRNAVLDAALRVFADAGFRRASLSEVSDEAGVTKGCLYHYFDSKGELLLALMRERSYSAADTCLISDDSSRDEALQLMVRSLWRRYEKEGQLELTTVALTELPHAPEIARVFFDEVVSKNRAFLRDTLKRTSDVDATPLARLQPDALPKNDERNSAAVTDEQIAMLVPYMVMGAALGYRLYRDIDPAVPAASNVEEALVQILLRGLAER